jgi:hypothetical protein
MYRIFSVLALGSLIAFSSGTAYAQNHRHGGMRDGFPGGTVETFSGTVVSADTVSHGCCMSRKGVHVTLKTDSETVTVSVGPSFYVDGKMSFEQGDAITVEGVRVDADGERWVVAKEIRKGTQVLSLRKDDGTPLWAGEGHRRWN